MLEANCGYGPGSPCACRIVHTHTIATATARPAVLSQVLGIVYRAISTFLIRRAGLRVGADARTGAVTLIQRFGSALNCFLHWSTVNARLTASGSCWMTRKRVAAGPLIRRVPCSHLR